jgi:hypothetical protein
MKTVRFEDAADEELIDEIVRYELRREGLGTEFLAAVREAVRLVTQNPGAWQASEHGRDVRRFVMDRFPLHDRVHRARRRNPDRACEPRAWLLAHAAVTA